MSDVTALTLNLAKRIIILDRDGVINYDSVNYIRTPDEWHPIPGSLEAIARLNRAGFRIAVATNQSGVGRGYYSENTLQNIHQKMLDMLAKKGGEIEVIFYCPHLPSAQCDCRKPKPGLLNKVAQHFNCSLELVPFIGDSPSDMEAAIAVHAAPIFITDTPHQLVPYPCFSNLSQAVDDILGLLNEAT